MAEFSGNKQRYGLADPARELQVREIFTDSTGATHVRFRQVYRGLGVFGAQAVAHVALNGTVDVTNNLRGGLNVNTTPDVDAQTARGVAVGAIAPFREYEIRKTELWVLPAGPHTAIDRLVWLVEVMVEGDAAAPAIWEYFIDAMTGDVVFFYDGLAKASAVGVGRTMYLGDRSIATELSSGLYLLRDPTRGGGNSTCDRNNKTKGACATFSRPTNIFGDGRRENSDRATAGADAHHGLQVTWDFFATTFGRAGVNSLGSLLYNRVHYGTSVADAFWDPACSCISFGDGNAETYPFVSVDIVAHEFSHGILSSGDLLGFDGGESAGLNESTADIFGAAVEAYLNSPDDLPDYWIGEKIHRVNWSGATFTPVLALRYMDDPARDGRSPACWSKALSNLTEYHYRAGPNNHMFYLLAQGGVSACNGLAVSGIGIQKATNIWYTAVTQFMGHYTDYRGARKAALRAAENIYGAQSPEYLAVGSAYSAINVLPDSFTYVWKASDSTLLTEDRWAAVATNPSSETFVKDSVFGWVLKVSGGSLVFSDPLLRARSLTVEIRAGIRFPRRSKNPGKVGQFALVAGNTLGWFDLLPKEVVLVSSRVAGDVRLSIDPSTALHTYRMIIGADGRTALYMDGNDVAVAEVAADGPFDDNSIRITGEDWYISHIAWKESAAFNFSQLPSP
jgi:Zn-dependent metalloprotease